MDNEIKFNSTFILILSSLLLNKNFIFLNCISINPVQISNRIAIDMKDIDYITRDFVRQDCGVHGATFSDENCDTIIAEVARLTEEGIFSHTGVYWIANQLAAEGKISPRNPQNCNSTAVFQK